MTNQQTGTSASQDDKPEKHLYRQVVQGGAWVMVLRIGQQVLALVRLVVLARILSPADFGLLGIALLTMRITKIFTETGFVEALIQRKGNVTPYLNAAWTIHVFRGLILFGVLYMGAPFLVQCFENPNEALDVNTATMVFRVLAVTFLLGGFANIGVIFFSKDLEFNKHFLRQICGTLVDVIVAVTLALLYRSVWALVWGKLAGETVQFFLSYILHPHRPRIHFDWPKIRELWAYGKWGLGMAVIGFLVMEGDDLLVAKILGLTQLGLYKVAHTLGWLPITEVTVAISFVTFPAYAKVQDNIPRVREAYLKVLQFTAFLSFPLAVMLIVLGEDFTLLFMKAKWLDMVPALQLLATMAIFNSLATCTAPLFRAVGRPKIVTYLMFGKLVFLAVLIYPFIKYWGITGAAAAVLFSTLLNQPLVYYMVVKILGCRYRDFLRVLLSPAVGVLAMTAAVAGVKYILGTPIGIGAFLLCAVSGMIGYIITVFSFDRIIGLSMKEIIREQLKIFRSGK